MTTHRIAATLILICSAFLGYFVYASESPDFAWSKPFKLGLDLSGGTHLVYKADVSDIAPGEVDAAMSALKDVIERRINVFGVSEPIIQVEKSGVGEKANHKLIVELPGITDVREAQNIISKTPTLEFKTEAPNAKELAAKIAAAPTASSTELIAGLLYQDTKLTGKYLERAQVEFPSANVGAPTGPVVVVKFNAEGARLFTALTEANVGKTIGIFLDGELISSPVVQEPIRTGDAVISGNFALEEAQELVRNLNLGALPVPISLDSTETVGPTLGADVLNAGIWAGLIGLLALAIFMILWYRLPGVVAVVALIIYIIIILAIFKLLPVTITAAGIAGLILSIGIAVDANVLIFERLKEEMAAGHSIHEATKEGFARAWLSIRDSNLSGIISAVVLFWFGTSIIKGFALTLIIGILVSMFSAITVTRTFLFALGVKHKNKVSTFLFSNGFHK